MTLEDIKDLEIDLELNCYLSLKRILDEDDLNIIIESLEDYYGKNISDLSNREVESAVYDYLYDNDDIVRNALLEEGDLTITLF